MAKKKLTTELKLISDTDYGCSYAEEYDDVFSLELEVPNTSNDSFTTLVSGTKTKGLGSVEDAKAILVKNTGNICAEILISAMDWKTSDDVDVVNSVDVGGGGETYLRSFTMLLPAGRFFFLPNSRMLSYSSSDDGAAALIYESAANAGVGNIGIEPKDINSGNEYRGVREINATTYGTGTEELTDEPVAVGETEIDVDDADWFKSGDLIMIDSEVMEVESVSSNTLTVKRGLLGSVEVTHTEDDELLYFFGNEYLAFDVGKCKSDSKGRFSQRGAFFGYARTTDKKVDGVVPGTVAIGPFYTEGGFLDWGLSGITANQTTGLAANTAYTFTIVVDEHHVNGFDSVTSEVNIAFTTDSSDTTWAGSSNAVLPKIQAVFDEQFYTTSSGLLGKKVSIGIVGGDVRVTSHSNHSDTRVGIGNVTGTTPFSVGSFPSLDGNNIPNLLGAKTANDNEVQADTVVYGPASTLAKEEIEDPVSGKQSVNLKAFILDDGNGNLLYMGRKVGKIDYNLGHCSWQVASLPNAEFKISARSHSAHSGGASFVANAYNTIQNIKARSVNKKDNAKIKILTFG